MFVIHGPYLMDKTSRPNAQLRSIFYHTPGSTEAWAVIWGNSTLNPMAAAQKLHRESVEETAQLYSKMLSCRHTGRPTDTIFMS